MIVPVFAADDPFRLAADIQPIAQQVFLRIDPELPDYSGSTTITVSVGSRSESIRLHAEDMQIDNLRVSLDDRDIPVRGESGDFAMLTVTADQPFAPGTYEIEIDFSNDFNVDGVGIHRNELDGQHYIFTQFEAVDARKGFPCFDEPGFKFPWQLTISVPENVLAISNTPADSVVTANGWTTTDFASTPPLPSYLITLAVGDFDTVPIEGLRIPGRVIAPRGKAELADFAVATTPPLLSWLEDYFDEPYPFSKLDLIATVGSFSGAMEHPGAITYSDYFLLLDRNASARQKSTQVRITAHELAHQWFGNLVTMQWWNDLWLNEAFADWMGDKTVARVYPGYKRDLASLSTLFQVMETDSRPTTRPIRKDFGANDNFEEGVFLSYYKGKTVLNMFEQAVGPDIFREGIIRYLRKFSRGNAEAADLWTEIDAGAPFDLARGLQSFIDQPGIPLVSVARLGGGRFEFSQSPLVALESDAERPRQWMIPVTYRYLAGDELRTGFLLLDEAVQVVDLGDDVQWVLPNADQAGYFRWQVPADMLAALGDAAGSQFTVRERMGMLSNSWALLTTDVIDGEELLLALENMSADTDPAVLQELLNELNDVRQTFITPDLRDEFAGYVQKLLVPTFERIGSEAVPGENAETAELRAQALLWLSDYGRYQPARQATAELAARHFAGDLPLDSFMAVILRAEARRGDRELYEALRQRFEAADDSNERLGYASALGSFRDPDTVREILAYTLEGSLQRVDLQEILNRLSAWVDNNAMILDWLMANDAALRDRLPASRMAGIPTMMVTCTPDNLETLQSFYGAPERDTPGMATRLEMADAQARECWELRQRELGAVRSYLQ